jgi:DNA end-binding protein Ku
VLARQVIESLVAEFDGQALTSQYRQDLRRMLEAKLAGEEIAQPEPVEEAPVIDLMEALRASVADAESRRSSADESKPKRPARRRKAAAK